MNQDGITPPGSAKDFQSDQDSASPAASSSEKQDGTSSADTTPPPQADMFNTYSGSYTGKHHKRYSSGNTFSRSYQSRPLQTFSMGAAYRARLASAIIANQATSVDHCRQGSIATKRMRAWQLPSSFSHAPLVPPVHPGPSPSLSRMRLRCL
jgi:hypothetical protein